MHYDARALLRCIMRLWCTMMHENVGTQPHMHYSNWHWNHQKDTILDMVWTRIHIRRSILYLGWSTCPQPECGLITRSGCGERAQYATHMPAPAWYVLHTMMHYDAPWCTTEAARWCTVMHRDAPWCTDAFDAPEARWCQVHQRPMVRKLWSMLSIILFE